MPLRVAEQDGYLHAVNKCYDCPYIEHIKNDNRFGPFFACGKQGERKGGEVRGISIPVWCPLPIYQMVREKEKEVIKMRGKHPGNIMWDAPAIFVVEDVEIDGLRMNITIRPELPQGPDYTCLRKDDCLRADKINYLVTETPTSSRIKVGGIPKLNKGDRLIANGPAWEEKRSKNA